MDKEIIIKILKKYEELLPEREYVYGINPVSFETLASELAALQSEKEEPKETISYLKCEYDHQLPRITKILGKKPTVFEQGVNALLYLIESQPKAEKEEPVNDYHKPPFWYWGKNNLGVVCYATEKPCPVKDTVLGSTCPSCHKYGLNGVTKDSEYYAQSQPKAETKGIDDLLDEAATAFERNYQEPFGTDQLMWIKGCLKSYASQPLPSDELRNELIAFSQRFYADEETCIHNVDKYLRAK